jgi:hypothetical protein
MAAEAYSTRNHFGGAAPFKIQVNFDIPLFEGRIDTYALEKWLNMLEVYYFVQKNSRIEKITFMLLKSLPHVRAWWEGVGNRSFFRENHNVGGACRRSNACKADTHAGKETHAKQTCMQKRKACEECMQEDLDMIGLGFW